MTITAVDDQFSSEPEAPEWDGEGLPPVGCECGFTHPGVNGWHHATILGYYKTEWADSGGAAVVKCPTLFGDYPDGVSVLNIDEGMKFRPLRTPAQRAEEEAVDDLMRIYRDNDSVSVRDAMKEIYRAGYRKLEDEK